jgi:hypothetical protein
VTRGITTATRHWGERMTLETASKLSDELRVRGRRRQSIPVQHKKQGDEKKEGPMTLVRILFACPSNTPL